MNYHNKGLYIFCSPLVLILLILPNLDQKFIFVQQHAAAALQALEQSQPAARHGESWLALCAPWPV